MENNLKLLKDAHKQCSYHRDAVMSSDRCGCFYCLEVYPPTEVREWTDAGQTALCPKCGIDSVLASASGYPLEGAFMQEMYEHWFGDHDDE
jgi:hypothetical protein